jgi:hypothetical protein
LKSHEDFTYGAVQFPGSTVKNAVVGMPNINSLLQKKAKVEPLNEGEAGRRSRDAQALQANALKCLCWKIHN